MVLDCLAAASSSADAIAVSMDLFGNSIFRYSLKVCVSALSADCGIHARKSANILVVFSLVASNLAIPPNSNTFCDKYSKTYFSWSASDRYRVFCVSR